MKLVNTGLQRAAWRWNHVGPRPMGMIAEGEAEPIGMYRKGKYKGLGKCDLTQLTFIDHYDHRDERLSK